MKLLDRVLRPLPCAGKLGNCPAGLTRFRFSCLACRWRRRYYRGFTDPSYWIAYTYKSLVQFFFTNRYVRDGVEYTRSDGGLLKVEKFHTLRIDPRGCFTGLRCAVIVMLDQLMGRLHVKKPLVEFCEFFANYPC